MLAIPAKALDQVILNADNPAPFRGVLVPESTYRRMWVDIKERDLLKSELQVCLDHRTQYDDVSESTWLGMGFLAGLLSGIILSNALK